MSLTVEQAAERLVALWRADREAQHTGLSRTSSPLPTAPTRAAILAAEHDLERAVMAARS